MATITQDLLFRLSLIRYAEKYGITKAAVKYHVNRQYIYRWKNVLMAHRILCAVSLEDHTDTLISITLMNLNLSLICGAETLTQVLLFSG